MREGAELDLRLFRIWMKASKTVFDLVRKDIERYDISVDHFMILELLYSKGPHPIQKISEIFSIPSGSITYVVDKLEKNGYVVRQASSLDRRTSNAALTEKGETLLAEIFPQHSAMISHNLSALNEEEKLVLAELLKKVGLGAAGLKKE